MPSRRAKQPPAVSPAVAFASAKPGLPMFVLSLIVVYILLASAYNRLIPFESGAGAAALVQSHQLPVNPDEAAHVANAYRYKAGVVPVFQAGNPDFEAHQPPLYYVLIAPLIAQQNSHAVRPAAAARWFSVLIGAALLFFVWATIREITPDSPAFADTAACICLLPTSVNVCASISNDVLTNAVVAAASWQLVRVIRLAADSRPWLRQTVVLGVLLAAGIYTKTSTLVLFPAVIIAGVLLARQGVIQGQTAVKIIAVSCGVGLVLAAPWLTRNTLLYGDPLAQHIFNTAFSRTTITTADLLTVWTPQEYTKRVVSWSFESFWAVFDGMRLFLPMWVYLLLAAVALVQAIGAARWLRRAPLTPTQRIALASLATVAVATVLAFARFNTSFFQAQGRYLYPGLAFFGFILAAGTFGWLSAGVGLAFDRFRWVPYATAIALLILNLVSLYTLHNAFPAAA